MSSCAVLATEMSISLEERPLAKPFSIAGHTFTERPVVLVVLRRGAHIGRGEAVGVGYLGETPEQIARQLAAVSDAVKAGAGRLQARDLLPPGGARNALDSALWDLESKERGAPVWALAGVSQPKRLLTTFTVGVETPEVMTDVARGYEQARAIKLKLSGDADDAERVKHVRAARPDVWLAVDANQGFDLGKLEAIMPVLVEADVQLIEQPLPRGEDERLSGFDSPIPLAADESVQGLSELKAAADRYQVINIKLDKCGGLTEGLELAHRARDLGLQVMVGNMMGTTLSLAPAFVLGQLCDVVDLDGPIFMREDRPPSAIYEDGYVWCPPEAWGHPAPGGEAAQRR